MTTTDDSDLIPPHPAALFESLRAVGYALPTAIADLVDNSLAARCKKIDIRFHWAGEASAIAVADDGAGMSERSLVGAMRVGSRNPRDVRTESDLGRFGLGLKTASLSQGRRVTVFSRELGAEWHVRCWDLDLVAESAEWRLSRQPTELAGSIATAMANGLHGTVVVIEKLDRLTHGAFTDNDSDEDAFLRRLDDVKEHFGLVFHRFMAGASAVEFTVNGVRIGPWDPFLESQPATRPLASEPLVLGGHLILVQPFVLPHLSKLTEEEHNQAAGLKGWNAHQGFYIYRNKRLLVPGDWLGLKGWKQEEHYKLARIRIDLSNAVDDEWQINIAKSRATPPHALRRELIRIGERTRSLAKQVYAHRGAKLLPKPGQQRVFLWDQLVKHGSVFYRVNREHPLLTTVREGCDNTGRFDALVRLLEETVPVALITIADREMPDRTVGEFGSAKEQEVLEVMKQVYASLLAGGLQGNDAHARLSQIAPFGRFPHLLQIIKELDQ